jgi:hypothetical protein
LERKRYSVAAVYDRRQSIENAQYVSAVTDRRYRRGRWLRPSERAKLPTALLKKAHLRRPRSERLALLRRTFDLFARLNPI